MLDRSTLPQQCRTPTYAIVGNDVNGVGASPVRLVDASLQQCHTQRQPCLLVQLCADNRFRNDACLVDGHPCMAEIQPLTSDRLVEASTQLKPGFRHGPGCSQVLVEMISQVSAAEEFPAGMAADRLGVVRRFGGEGLGDFKWGR